ncbi:nucleoside hydrolase [Brevibacillus sp. SIMBA_040]|uniref:nucleoside hydrolase n=1 Tax=unclassified Brevibacillus TaxID=2684853 RepID=UPI00397939D1
MRDLAQKQQLLIDFCGGIDHAIALAYALQAPDTKIVGVICSDSDARRGISLAQKVIDWAKPGYEIDIVAGEQRPLFASPSGNTARVDESSAGVRLLLEKAQEAEGELTLVTLGSLTTLAKAAAAEPMLAKQLKHVVIQGGAIRVPGDVTAIAEANMHADPEAASFVLAAGLPILLVPLDATHAVTLTNEQAQGVVTIARNTGLIRAEYADWQPDAADLRLSAWGAMVAALDPSVITTQQMKLTIDCTSTLSRGAVLADLRAKPSVGRDTDVCVRIEAEKQYQWLQSALEQEGNRR